MQTSDSLEDSADAPSALGAQLLQIVQTRIEAAVLVAQLERDHIVRRLVWRVISMAAMGFALWVGVVWLAIALPPQIRLWVLGGLAIGAVLLFAVARLALAPKPSDALSRPRQRLWRVLRSDLDSLTRSLNQAQPTNKPERAQAKQSVPDHADA